MAIVREPLPNKSEATWHPLYDPSDDFFSGDYKKGP